MQRQEKSRTLSGEAEVALSCNAAPEAFPGMRTKSRGGDGWGSVKTKSGVRHGDICRGSGSGLGF